MKKILGVLIIPIMLVAFTGIAEAAEPIDYEEIAKDYQQTAMSKNPCATNPCASSNDALKHGEKLWEDVSLGNSGRSCATCHPNGQGLYNTEYPKYIKMPDKVVSLKEMINFCMKGPMEAEPLDYNGPEMEALAAYINAYSLAPNPCGTSNPCTVKNPCGAM